MGVALGTLTGLLGAQATVGLGAGGIGWLLPLVFALVLLILRRAKQVSLARVCLGGSHLWMAAAVTALLGVATLVPSILRTPLADGYVVGTRYHGDLVFFESVAQFVSRMGPSDSSLLADYGIRYHWFSYAWVGSVTEVSGSEAFVVMTRVFPFVMVVGATLLAVAWAALLSSRKWTPLLAGLLVVVAGFVGAGQGVILNYDSPSTSYGAVLALAFGVGLTVYLRQESRRLSDEWPSVAILAVLAAGMVGAKASQAVVVLAGLGVLAVGSLWLLRELRRRSWTVFAAAGLAMLVTYLVVIAGVAPSSTNIALSLAGEKVSTFQGLDPFAGWIGGLLGSIILILAILPRWLGIGWLSGQPGNRQLPEVIFALGLALAGVVPIVLLSSGTNAGWFAVAASPLLAVLSAVGLERGLDRISGSIPRFVSASVLAAVVVNVGVFAAYVLAQVSGATVLWRGIGLAWMLAALCAVAVVWWSGSQHQFGNWLLAVATVLVLASVGARFNGAALWSVTEDRLTPVAQEIIRWSDPDAEFTTATPDQSVGGSGSSPTFTSDSELSETDSSVAGSTSELLQWSPNLNEAALWLAPQVADGELVAEDATYLQPFLPVVTDLTMYVAGEPYISGYTTSDGARAAIQRQERVDAFLVNPSEETAGALRDDRVGWLWLRMTPPERIEELQSWASVALQNDQVTVMRINDPGANSK